MILKCVKRCVSGSDITPLLLFKDVMPFILTSKSEIPSSFLVIHFEITLFVTFPRARRIA